MVDPLSFLSWKVDRYKDGWIDRYGCPLSFLNWKIDRYKDGWIDRYGCPLSFLNWKIDRYGGHLIFPQLED